MFWCSPRIFHWFFELILLHASIYFFYCIFFSTFLTYHSQNDTPSIAPADAINKIWKISNLNKLRKINRNRRTDDDIIDVALNLIAYHYSPRKLPSITIANAIILFFFFIVFFFLNYWTIKKNSIRYFSLLVRNLWGHKRDRKICNPALFLNNKTNLHEEMPNRIGRRKNMNI